MPRTVLVALRALLVLLLLGSLLVQLSVGSVALTALDGGPVDGVLVAVVVAGVLCIEVVLVSIWRLLTLARDDALFAGDHRSDLWVDLAIGAFVAGSVLATVGAVAVFAAVPAPLPALAFALVAVASAALALLVVVMRRLLHLAVEQRSELAEVV
ncbi:DUF2975 domain-containing protein [Rathayibacter oskolensis]|uniref:DUF2975 domain-containing protein n=1 Tax=Rathayibacter TaxID=33886 RepID=UPI0013161881|nr:MULTISPECIES: DUF2975 domain-containing protein [Rathayibacter]QHC65732.1 DUF2975 domain-containing protein [Rathayibacter sp. VKM Ac-2759]WKK70557.1 DUF2975 domain-containing protein [Rathayibacter oskolensis]